jgi:hypothetical protein
MNIPDHFSWRLEQFFGLNILKFFYVDLDPGHGIFMTLDPGWKDSDPGFGISIPLPNISISMIFLFLCIAGCQLKK